MTSYHVEVMPDNVRLYLIGYPNSLTPLNSKTALVWRLNVDGNSRRWNRLHAKCPILGIFGDY
jgi:hypothetical protein